MLRLDAKARAYLRADMLAGLSGAIAGTPQAMGFALIAGINPIYGLYTAIISTIVGALVGRSSFMTVAPTNALSLVVASTLMPFSGMAQVERLFTLTFLVGVFHLGFGVLRLGAMVRFVSNAVMTGFVTGAALLIIFGQLRHLNAYAPVGDSILARLVDWVRHWHMSDPTTLLISFITMGIMLGVRQTRYKNWATLTGIGGATLLVMLMGWSQVTLVRDISDVPAGLPPVTLPNMALAPELALAALSVAILGAVQSAAITHSVQESDGQRPQVNRDFIGIGLGNIIGSCFQSMPACGSLSRTAVNVMAGAQSRWANVFAGIFVALFLLLFGELIGYVTLSALAVQLVIAAISLISWQEIQTVWKVNLSARLAMVTTFVLALIAPLEYSIYGGVAISVGLYLYSSTNHLEVIRLVPLGDGRFRVADVPQQPEEDILIISVQGYLYFGAIDYLEKCLPDPRYHAGLIVILRLRHDTFLASTGIHCLERYQESLKSGGGRLILTGLSSALYERIQRTSTAFTPDNLYLQDEVIFGGTSRAYADALIQRAESSPSPPATS